MRFVLNTLYEVLDYLETDDYDDTCEYHIEMIEKVKESINELEYFDNHNSFPIANESEEDK